MPTIFPPSPIFSMERKLKKREVLERLNLTEYSLAQFIAKGILDDPVRLTKTSHPFWTDSQIQRAEQKLLEIAANTGNGSQQSPDARPRMKPISTKMGNRIRSSGARPRV